MLSFSIVPNLYIMENGHSSFSSSIKPGMVNHFGFQSIKKALGYGIIPTIPLSGHGLLNRIFSQEGSSPIYDFILLK